MSRKAYMKKWRNLTDEEADVEIKQIALERQILEDSFMGTSFNGNEGVPNKDENKNTDEGDDQEVEEGGDEG